MPFVYNPDVEFGDFNTDGIPASGAEKPVKSRLRAMFRERDAVLEASLASGSLIFGTKLQIDADLAHAANTQAWVVLDSTVANNGIYRKSGSSGSGSWTRVADLPYSFIRLVDAGAGTANAIVATSSIPLPGAAMVAVMVMNVFEANSGNVTIAANGATAKPLLTNSGNQVSAAGIAAGMFIVFVDDGTNFRLLSDQASAAIQVAAEAARDIAVAAALAAAASLASLGAVITGDLTVKTDAYALQITDIGDTIVLNAATGKAFTLPLAANAAIPFQVRVYNMGLGQLTVSAQGGNTVNGVASVVLDQWQGAVLISDGVSAWLSDAMAALISDGAITTAKLAAAAVTEAKIETALVADFRRVDPNGARTPMRYYSSTGAQFAYQPGGFAMGGFRFQGMFKRNRVPVFAAPAPSDSNRHLVSIGNTTSTPGDLAFEGYSVGATWYAVFACANNGDAAAQFKITPFLKVGSIAGSVVTLSASGEASYTAATARTHQFTTNGLANAEVLVISETLNSRPNAWSGRLATVTANTTTTVTLSSVGTMAAHDYFLPAPKFDHYRYIGSFYLDAGSPDNLRNFGDSGNLVKSRGSNIGTGGGWAAGSIASPGVRVTPIGHVCPLATGITLVSTVTLSTGSTGSVVENYAIDGSVHDVWNVYDEKVVAAGATWVHDDGAIPFMFAPDFYMWTAGSLVAARTGALRVTGWMEP